MLYYSLLRLLCSLTKICILFQFVPIELVHQYFTWTLNGDCSVLFFIPLKLQWRYTDATLKHKIKLCGYKWSRLVRTLILLDKYTCEAFTILYQLLRSCSVLDGYISEWICECWNERYGAQYFLLLIVLIYLIVCNTVTPFYINSGIWRIRLVSEEITEFACGWKFLCNSLLKPFWRVMTDFVEWLWLKLRRFSCKIKNVFEVLLKWYKFHFCTCLDFVK